MGGAFWRKLKNMRELCKRLEEFVIIVVENSKLIANIACKSKKSCQACYGIHTWDLV